MVFYIFAQCHRFPLITVIIIHVYIFTKYYFSHNSVSSLKPLSHPLLPQSLVYSISFANLRAFAIMKDPETRTFLSHSVRVYFYLAHQPHLHRHIFLNILNRKNLINHKFPLFFHNLFLYYN